MFPHLVKVKETGEQFLVMDMLSHSIKTGAQIYWVNRLFVYDKDGNPTTLDVDDCIYDGLMPMATVDFQPKPEQQERSPLFIPGRR